MKVKSLIQISLSTALALSLSGCLGGKEVSIPVTKRKQSIDPEAIVKIHKDNQEVKEKIDIIQKAKPIASIKTSHPELYALLESIALRAQELYSKRKLDKDLLSKGPQFLQKGQFDKLKIVMESTESKKLEASYMSFDVVTINNYEENKDKKELLAFVIAHEFAHALSLHYTEEESRQVGIGKAFYFAQVIAEELIYDTLYSQVAKTNPLLANKIDNLAAKIFQIIGTSNDLATEKLILAARKLSGKNQTIPSKTKIVLKKFVASGLSGTEAFKMLSQEKTDLIYSINLFSQHPKEQELEADKIAAYLAPQSVQTVCTTYFIEDSDAKYINAHPSHKDRKTNLKCAN